MKELLVLLSLSMLFGCYSKAPERTSLKGQPLPAFNLLQADSITYYNTASAPTGKAVAVLYFATYCPYCLQQVDDIIDDMDQLKDIQFYFVANAPATSLRAYIDQHQLARYPNITVLQDSSSAVADYLQLTGVPYIALYTPDKKFNSSYLGKIPTSKIIADTKAPL